MHTFKLDAKVRAAAKDTDNTVLYAKLQNGDMVAQDALYHSDCLCQLYRDASKARIGEDVDHEKRKLHGLAFAKVISFIDEMLLESEEIIPVFKLADLIKFYTKNLNEVGITDHYVHSTRFKKRVMEQYEDMFEETQGKDVILAFRGNLADIISCATHTDYDDEGMLIADVSKILRRDLLKKDNTVFNGKFDPCCQEDSIPASVECLLSTTMHGNHTWNPHYRQAVLSIGQLIRFNTLKRTRVMSSSMYHTKDREPPLSIYIGELIHSETRNMDLVDKFAHLGLGISKERLLQVSTSVGNAAIDTFERDDVVAPMCLQKGLFCTSAIDNIDINPKSSTAKTSLHGTAASINQHRIIDSGIQREPVLLDMSCKTLKHLPDEYTDIFPLHLPEGVLPPANDIAMDETPSEEEPATDHEVPTPADNIAVGETPSEKELLADEEWLENDELSWAAFHSRREVSFNKFIEDQSALLPIWRDDSKSPATIRHALNMLRKAIHFLNPGQTIVTTLDQPLYAIAKKLQWYFPNEYGVSQFVFVLGSLHTEMAMLSTLGDWFEGSGWLTLLSNANVTGTGNQSLLTGKEVSKTKYCHQVTASVLHRLMRDAYKQNNLENELNFESWRAQMETQFPQFRYWSICLKIEMTLFLFTRSIRSRNFVLYIYAINQLLQWMFTLDHFHYSRWLSVHLFDMERLHHTNVDIFDEFKENGNFVVARTQNKFSSMGIDHRHEQLNADIKGTGGAMGLTEDEQKFLRWMVCGPEEARMVREFEEQCILQNIQRDTYRHHEDSPSFQQMFRRDVNNLEAEFQTHGNPFEPSDHYLIHLISNDVMHDNIAQTLQTIEKLGAEQKNAYLLMLQNNPSGFDQPIKKNTLPLFRNPRTKTKVNNPMKEAKDQLHLFSQLYVATQVRGGNMDEFFRHETLSHPPALAKNGQMRSGDKTDILPHLKKFIVEPTDHLTGMPEVDAVVMEGSVLVNLIKPNKNNSFSQYAEDTLFPYLTRYQRNSQAIRVDMVFDTYPSVSLKGITRLKRGEGVRRKVTSSSITPSNWKGFLRSSENKTELFRFLSAEIFSLSNGRIICGYDDTVTSTHDEDTALLSPTDHEEADTRVFLHVKDMVSKGFRRVMVRTTDTDVLVLAISLFSELNIDELWLDFGTAKQRTFLPVHRMALDPIRRAGLRFFYCFTGCDQVSFFNYAPKSTAWKVWEMFLDVNDVFVALSYRPTDAAIADAMPLLERYVVLLYHRTSTCVTVNSCRRELFCNGRAIDNMPPTRDALLQHTKRAAFLGGFVWGSSLVPQMNLPSFEWYGYKDDATPHWTNLPEASRGVRELVKCNCLKGCKGNCKCTQMNLQLNWRQKCTELCKCKGTC